MSNELALRPGGEVADPLPREQWEATATQLADVFARETRAIAAAMDMLHASGCILKAALEPNQPGNSFEVRFEYNGSRYWNASDKERIFKEMERRAWRAVIDKLGVKAVMSVAERTKYEQQLERGELPGFTAANVMGVVAGLAQQASRFGLEAAREVFDFLRPQVHGSGYKTNSSNKQLVGRKVILTWMVEKAWAAHWRVIYNQEKYLTALDAIFLLLDGKGVLRDHRGPLVQAIEKSDDGRGETDYFRFKCFANRNLHLVMLREDLVKELNFHAAGVRELGVD